MTSAQHSMRNHAAALTARCCAWLLLVISCATLSRTSLAQSCSPSMLSIWGSSSYLAVGNDSSLRFRNGFTIECWGKLDGVNKQTALLDKGSGGISYYGLFVDSGKIIGRLQQTSTIRLQAVIPNPGAWHHFALVFKPGDSAYLYIDGSGVASQAVSSTLLAYGTDSLRIGSSAAGSSFIGEIDEVRLWNAPRSAAAINAVLATSLSGNETGLAAYYPLDDDPGSSRIHDFSNHHLDGVLRGSSIEIGSSTSPVTRPTAGFRLDALEKTMDLGTRRCDPSFDTLIHVRNLGTQSLLVNSVAPFRGNAFSVTTDLPFTLPADSTKYFAIKIHFSASGGGIYNDSLYISSADNCGGTLRIGLHAVYDSVGVTVSPSSLAIGSRVQCDWPALQTASVRNISTTDSVRITGVSGFSSGVSLLTTLPIRLAPGETKPIAIRIDSGSRGAYDVDLSLGLDKCSREAVLNVQGYRSRAEFGVPNVVDFGGQDADLTGVSRDTILLIANTGDRGMQILGYSTSDVLLKVLEQRAPRFLNPGDTMQVHVRYTATQCGVNEARLHIRGFYCGFDTAATFRMTLRTPEQLVAQSLRTDVTCNFADTVLWVKNPNSTPMKVDTMTFDQDAIFFVRPFTFPVTIAPLDSARIDIRFNPGTNGDYNVTGYIMGEPCSITPVRLLGSKGINGVTFAPKQLDFGRGCSTASVTQLVTLTNASSRTVTITDTVYSGSRRFALDPLVLPLVLPSGARVTVRVHYNPSLGALDTGRFSLIAKEGCPAASLRLRGSREIPRVAAIEQTIGFDTLCPGFSAFRTLHFQNAGVDSVDIGQIAVAPPYFVTSAPKVLASGRTDSVTIRFTPLALLDASRSLLLPFGSCGDTLRVDLNGSGGPVPELRTSADTLNFGAISIHDSTVRCLTISNASCSPLYVNGSTLRIDNTRFHFSASAQIDTVSRGRSTFICITFSPKSREESDGRLTIFDDHGDSTVIILRGQGIGPQLVLTPRSLDFGSVLHGAHRDMGVLATNVGNATAHLTYSATAPDFTIYGPDSIASGTSDSVHIRFAPGITTFKLEALGLLSYDELQDTVDLVGLGSERGLQLSATAAEFGLVHVDRDSITQIALTAIADAATVTKISTSQPNAVFTVTQDKTLPYTMQEGDTIWLEVTYHPQLETSDVGSISIVTDKGVSNISLAGRGVSEHIAVNATAIDVGDVELGSSMTVPRITITNRGTYTLTLRSTSTRAFTTAPDVSGKELAPGESLTLEITFAPSRARRIVDTLSILSSAPEGTQYVQLTGRGVYPIATRPQFSYTVASAKVRSGDRIALPVSIDGTYIEHIDADSTMLSIAFDPTMLRVLDVASPNVRYWNVSHDSELTVVLGSAPTSPSRLFDIRTEALLGAHRTTLVRVIDADPKADNAPLGVDGQFTVTDCDGNLHGVGFVGDYTLQQSTPNPARDNATIHYSLGLAGDVMIEIYNEIGRRLKVLRLGEQSQGQHTVAIDLRSLPPGRYTYRLKSLEYSAEGSLVIVR